MKDWRQFAMDLETLNPDFVEEIFARHGASSITLTDAARNSVNGGNMLALSGILSEQVDEVLVAYGPWIEFEEHATRKQGEQTWARLTGRRIED